MRLFAKLVRVALALLASTSALLPALPVKASMHSPDTDDPAVATTSASTVVSEDRETIASLRPQAAADEEGTPVPARPTVTDIVFPLASAGSYTESFGEPRDGGLRSHKGIDIFAEKLTPVVAAADGTVVLVRDTIGGDCCAVRLRHANGSETLYLHLNNDTPGTDDGLGYGIAEGIAVGLTVRAGQVIGYVGDSGNAEDTPPHLHFEYHEPSGTAIDPYAMLRISQGADPAVYAAMQEIPTELAFTGVSTLALATAGFAMVLIGVVLVTLDRCDDMWQA
jgi:murein DD-endopeptidase MepM/ murein hydrolase activator NlpD